MPRTRGRGLVLSEGFPLQDAGVSCRALLEGQALAMERRLQPLGQITELRAVGGASQSGTLLQIVADVLDCRVQPHSTPEGAGLGAALQALRFVLDRDAWWELVDSATASDGVAIVPRQPEAYDELRKDSRALEERALLDRSASL